MFHQGRIYIYVLGFINYYNNYMPLSVPMVLMSLITGKKVKTHTSQGIVKNKCTKPTKEF